MTVKYFMVMSCCLVASVLVFLGALLLLNETNAAFEKESLYINAPKLTGEDNIIQHMHKLVWISGSLRSQEGSTVLTAPLSKKRCLYYHYEMSRFIEVEPDSDESSYWEVEKSEAGAVDVVLQAGAVRLALDPDTIVYKRTPPSTEKEEDIDGIKFRFVEYTVPLENTVTAIGILGDGVLAPSERGTILSTSSFREVMIDFKSDVIFSLFFVVLFFLTAAGLLVLFIKLLLAERIPGPTAKEVLFFFGALVYLWILVAGVLLSMGSESLEEKILWIIMLPTGWGLVLLIPLVFFACRNKASRWALLFIPAIGAGFLSGVFYYDAFFTTGNRILPLFAAIPLSFFAACIMSLCRRMTGRKSEYSAEG